MSDYDVAVQILEAELGQVERVFRALTESDWRTPTLLRPVDEKLPPWTLFELAGHFDISIGLARMLIASQQPGQVGRDRVSFAYTMVDGKHPGQMADVLNETFGKTIQEARATPPDTVGSGYYALMRLGEFIPSRVVEAVVHGIDLTDTLGQDSVATPGGLALTAAILDELLARRTVGGRPADLSDDMAWVRAASGRSPHPDPRLPLIG